MWQIDNLRFFSFKRKREIPSTGFQKLKWPRVCQLFNGSPLFALVEAKDQENGDWKSAGDALFISLAAEE